MNVKNQDVNELTLLDFPQEDIAVITLNLPDKRNPLTVEMRIELRNRILSLGQDNNIRAIVITGAEGCFSAGGDLKSMEGITIMGGRERLEIMHQLCRAITRTEKPIIAAVEGFAVGAGLALAALCDIVVAAKDSTWSCPFNQIGLLPDTAAIWALPQRMGVGRARKLMLLGERIKGEQAVQDGLADVLCEPGKALDRALDICNSLIAKAPCSIAMTKAMLANFPQGLDQSLAAERDAQALLFQTKDFVEGRNAFYEKRKPEFNGD